MEYMRKVMAIVLFKLMIRQAQSKNLLSTKAEAIIAMFQVTRLHVIIETISSLASVNFRPKMPSWPTFSASKVKTQVSKSENRTKKENKLFKIWQVKTSQIAIWPFDSKTCLVIVLVRYLKVQCVIHIFFQAGLININWWRRLRAILLSIIILLIVYSIIISH